MLKQSNLLLQHTLLPGSWHFYVKVHLHAWCSSVEKNCTLHYFTDSFLSVKVQNHNFSPMTRTFSRTLRDVCWNSMWFIMRWETIAGTRPNHNESSKREQICVSYFLEAGDDDRREGEKTSKVHFWNWKCITLRLNGLEFVQSKTGLKNTKGFCIDFACANLFGKQLLDDDDADFIEEPSSKKIGIGLMLACTSGVMFYRRVIVRKANVIYAASGILSRKILGKSKWRLI